MPQNEQEVIEDVSRLHIELLERNAVAKKLEDYYRGRHPLPWVHKKARAEYRALVQQAVSNFPQLVVDSLNDRLTVTGFRVGEGADETLWNAWQENELDMRSPMVHQQALVTGWSYVSVWDGLVRPESMYEVYTESEPGDLLNVRRGMKAWLNKFDKKWYARYFADGVYVQLEAPAENAVDLVPESKGDPTLKAASQAVKWKVMQVDDDFACPFVPFVNRPDLDGYGWGEFEDVLPVIDRINTITAQMILAGELAAFKAKWATGIDIPTDDEGSPVAPFDIAMDRLLASENADAKFGVFDGTDIKQYQDAANQAITQLAAITRTPPFMLLGNLTNLSAEALKATESGQVKKAQQRQLSFGESWEAVMRLATGSTADDMETIWKDPENVSESQHVDALSKLYTMGLPQEAVWEEWGASPTQIERYKKMRAEDVMNRMMLQTASSAPGLQAAGDAGPQQQGTVQGGTGAAALAQTPNSPEV